MNIDTLGLELAELMEMETELLNKISCEEEELQAALRDNDWERMEAVISSLNPLSVKMEKIEKQRDLLYKKLKGKLNKKDTDGFYSIVSHMHGGARESCLSGYRKMKMALLRMQGITAGIDQYVRTVGDTSRAVLNEVFPHRKGRIYSCNGNERPAQADPMVLNRHL